MPAQLWDKHAEYKEDYPEPVFREHIYQELSLHKFRAEYVNKQKKAPPIMDFSWDHSSCSWIYHS